jgi:hypothetical protein
VKFDTRVKRAAAGTGTLRERRVAAGTTVLAVLLSSASIANETAPKLTDVARKMAMPCRALNSTMVPRFQFRALTSKPSVTSPALSWGGRLIGAISMIYSDFRLDLEQFENSAHVAAVAMFLARVRKVIRSMELVETSGEAWPRRWSNSERQKPRIAPGLRWLRRVHRDICSSSGMVL